MPLYFWDNWISTWIRRLEWVESLYPSTLLHSQWISRLSCTVSTQVWCWDTTWKSLRVRYQKYSILRATPEALPKFRIHFWCWEMKWNLSTSKGHARGAAKTECKLGDVWYPTDVLKLRSMLACVSCHQCPISRETRWCHMGFYPALKRSIQCWVGHK